MVRRPVRPTAGCARGWRPCGHRLEPELGRRFAALLYLGAALGGIGAGCVYGTCIGNALKWFPDRRGLAAGLTVAGYGIGSALTIIPIHHTIDHHGYEAAFLWFGL